MKLEVLLPVLAFHKREHDMELRLITAGKLAFAGLHERTVLLISREALRLFDTNEVRAIGAHELGHDYLWDDYEEARDERATRDDSRNSSCGAMGSPSSRWWACAMTGAARVGRD